MYVYAYIRILIRHNQSYDVTKLFDHNGIDKRKKQYELSFVKRLQRGSIVK
jgi:hypothetical protein